MGVSPDRNIRVLPLYFCLTIKGNLPEVLSCGEEGRANLM